MAESIFDPRVIASIDRLELRARRLVEGFMVGIHRSPYRGVSTDFAEHRLYSQGDDLRHLDWKVYARSDHFYVKRYEQETNLEARFLVDCSRSMFFRGGDAALTKFDYAATLAASLAYLLLRQNDAIGLNLFDHDIRGALPPRATQAHFRHFTDMLQAATPGEDTGLGQALRKTAIQIKRAGLVIVISDFLDHMSPFSEGLSLLDFEGNEVILFRIEDPWEQTFPFRGRTLFLGMEGEGKLLCDPLDLRTHYLRERERNITELYDICRRHGFFMEQTLTTDALDGVLSGFLNARAGARTRQL